MADAQVNVGGAPVTMGPAGFWLDATGAVAATDPQGQPQVTPGMRDNPGSTIYYDAGKDLNYTIVKGQKLYQSPMAYAGQTKGTGHGMVNPKGGLLKGGGTWNPQTGQFDQGANWGNILSLVVAGALTAGAADLIMGAPAGTAAAAASSGTVPGAASSAPVLEGLAAGPGAASLPEAASTVGGIASGAGGAVDAAGNAIIGGGGALADVSAPTVGAIAAGAAPAAAPVVSAYGGGAAADVGPAVSMGGAASAPSSLFSAPTASVIPTLAGTIGQVFTSIYGANKQADAASNAAALAAKAQADALAFQKQQAAIDQANFIASQQGNYGQYVARQNQLDVLNRAIGIPDRQIAAFPQYQSVSGNGSVGAIASSGAGLTPASPGGAGTVGALATGQSSANPSDPNAIHDQVLANYKTLGLTPTGPGSGPTDSAYYATQIAATGGLTPANSAYWFGPTGRIAQDAKKSGGGQAAASSATPVDTGTVNYLAKYGAVQPQTPTFFGG